MRQERIRRALTGLIAGLVVSTASAQTQGNEASVSTLIADRVEITADGKLIATGNVEALYGEARLKAGRIIYDQESDSLQIEGPVTLTQGENAVVIADSAELSPDLENGLLRSARVVLDQQLQLAAVEINRVDGRYTQLYQVVASSCEVCANYPVPLWQIRAESVVHDEVERQLYFDNAIFEVAGLPVMYLPQLRMPDPTVKRTTGFLTPTLRQSDELGFGIKVPYFITLGDSRDLTLAPYLSDRTRTLEGRYRQAFRNGDIEMEGAVSDDELIPGELRAYLFADGNFDLRNDFKLDFDVELVSDDAYLLDYDFSNKDRLDSALTLSRTRRDRIFIAEGIAYRSLRVDEDNQTQPFLVGDVNWVQRFRPGWAGGRFDLELNAHGHERRSDVDVEGRDIGRLTGRADWRRDWTGPMGMLLATEAHALLDHTVVNDDSTYPDDISDFTPFGVAEVRWPWIRNGSKAGHLIEPVMQLVWAPDEGEDGPRDESTQLEFDEGNLFQISRFPAGDARERGLRANLGFTYTRHDPSGWTGALTFGRIYRQKDLGQFAGFDTFDGTRSDWLTAVQFQLPENLTVTNRTLFDNAFDVTKNEMRLDWGTSFIDLGTSYIWMEPSEVEDRPDITHELSIDGDWQINSRWRSTLDWRYDIEFARSASTRWGVEYRTECVTFDFSVRRRFTSAEQDVPKTDYSFEVKLAGFGSPGGGRERPTRLACRS